MVLITLRAADEVRAAQFSKADGSSMPRYWPSPADRRATPAEKFDPNKCWDNYQEVLRKLIEAKMRRAIIQERGLGMHLSSLLPTWRDRSETA